MGKKWQKRVDMRLKWKVGAKQRKGVLTANGQMGTKYAQQIGMVRPRHQCEMCGGVEATWRAGIVCLCDRCYREIRSAAKLD